MFDVGILYISNMGIPQCVSVALGPRTHCGPEGPHVSVYTRIQELQTLFDVAKKQTKNCIEE